MEKEKESKKISKIEESEITEFWHKNPRKNTFAHISRNRHTFQGKRLIVQYRKDNPYYTEFEASYS